MRSVVIDTVVFVRSVWGQLVFKRRGTYRLVVSQSIVAEISEVLLRPEIARTFRFADQMDLSTVRAILAEADSVTVDEVPPVARDPKDDMFLATAKAAGADFLVSEDHDLLVLGEYEGTRIVDTAMFLAVRDRLQSDDTKEEREG